MMSKVFAVMAAVCAMAGVVHAADTYPSRPIRMIVAYPPGGGTDQVGRVLADQLTMTLGQNVVVDNRGGATGNIGTELAARAVPDGYTLLMGNVAPNAVNVSLFKKLGFDPVKDFAPVSLVAVTPNILVAHPSMPVKTIKELIAYAKAKPGTLNFPSAGVGSSSHLAGEMLKSLAGISMVHIPFKGGGPALVAVIAGEVQIMFATMPAAMPHVKSGKVKPVAVTTAKRSQAMPELPTIAESGVKGYEASTWYGLLAPARTPPVIVTRLHADTVKILAGPTRQRLEAQGFEPEGGTPAEFAAYIKTADLANVLDRIEIRSDGAFVNTEVLARARAAGCQWQR
jgi:tripartite-type tricarboxylate transporter receptor subunit TctC